MAETKPIAKAPGEIVSPEQVEQSPEQESVGFPIVGIGASAGGLSAFEAFFSAMPEEDPGMAFVYAVRPASRSSGRITAKSELSLTAMTETCGCRNYALENLRNERRTRGVLVV